MGLRSRYTRSASDAILSRSSRPGFMKQPPSLAGASLDTGVNFCSAQIVSNHLASTRDRRVLGLRAKRVPGCMRPELVSARKQVFGREASEAPLWLWRSHCSGDDERGERGEHDDGPNRVASQPACSEPIDVGGRQVRS